MKNLTLETLIVEASGSQWKIVKSPSSYHMSTGSLSTVSFNLPFLPNPFAFPFPLPPLLASFPLPLLPPLPLPPPFPLAYFPPWFAFTPLVFAGQLAPMWPKPPHETLDFWNIHSATIGPMLLGSTFWALVSRNRIQFRIIWRVIKGIPFNTTFTVFSQLMNLLALTTMNFLKQTLLLFPPFRRLFIGLERFTTWVVEAVIPNRGGKLLRSIINMSASGNINPVESTWLGSVLTRILPEPEPDPRSPSPASGPLQNLAMVVAQQESQSEPTSHQQVPSSKQLGKLVSSFSKKTRFSRIWPSSRTKPWTTGPVPKPACRYIASMFLDSLGDLANILWGISARAVDPYNEVWGLLKRLSAMHSRGLSSEAGAFRKWLWLSDK